VSLLFKTLLFPVVFWILFSPLGRSTGEPKAGKAGEYPIIPVPFTQVRFNDGFWAPRMETNRKVTIPYAFAKCEENGRMANFAIAGGLMRGEHRGNYPFDDTDPYKIIEGASYALVLHPDPELEKYLDDLIAKIAAAQEDDGYLYTCRTNKSEKLAGWAGETRWSNLSRSHELYNAGHMYEAAVAHFQATGKRTFLDVAIRSADHINSVFGPDKLRLPPGHQIIEMGLARLFRATGDADYLVLAGFFLNERGRTHDGRALWGAYCQDHLPVVEQDEAVGHAVRATYMYSGMADVAALQSDVRYIEAIDRLWENVVSRKLYITGGVGASGHGEAFGDSYELPNMSAYCETCAAIGNVYWNHRLFLLHGHAKHVDVMERTLYNALISGVSMDGKLFFYPNPLESHGQHKRSPWFGCACCPGNMTRFIASVPGYAYAHKGDVLYVNLYAASSADIEMKGNTVHVGQKTRYPWDGDVEIVVSPEREDEFSVHLRIPGWARNRPVPSDLYRFLKRSEEKPVIEVNGRPIEPDMEAGFARIRRAWKKGDRVTLRLPMPVRRVLAHENVKDDRGKAALQRGPIVYCAEWPDHEDGRVLNLFLPDDAVLGSEFCGGMLNGVQVITGRAFSTRRVENSEAFVSKETDLVAIPYYAWAHRGQGEMAVWLAREPDAARPLASPSIASSSKATASGGKGLLAVNDQIEPKSSIDHDNMFFHWWPRKGTLEWVRYDFEKAGEVSQAEVYWFDDTGIGECRLPASWRILYRDGEEWRQVYTTGTYGVEKDRYNRVVFETVKTDALRLEVQLPEEFSTGIHEWRVK